jgi:hypothetical protein
VLPTALLTYLQNGTTRAGWTIPREPGEKLGVIEDAPGSYVRTKS